MNSPRIILSSTGSYVPKQKVSNDELSKIVETSHDWIYARTGISYRHIADKNEKTSDMAFQAAEKAFEQHTVTKIDIDLLIVATVTPDHTFPATACYLQKKLGLRSIPAFDISAACSGFLYALSVAKSLLETHDYRHALIVGTEKFSSILNWQDRTTCVLFGDGAGAAILSKNIPSGFQIIDTLLGANGFETDILCTAQKTEQSLNQQHAAEYVTMNGKEVFKQAVRTMESTVQTLLNKNHLAADAIKLYIPHQANMRIIEALSKAFNRPLSHFFTNLMNYGNTSAASIPIALNEALKENSWQKGDYIVLVAFGAGLTWGATLLQYQ